MDLFLSIMNWVGIVTTLISFLILLWGIYAWGKGILPALIRLGNGLAKRKIAIFAKPNNLTSLQQLLHDSKLFKEKNILTVSSSGDFGRAEKTTLFLVFWPDWQPADITDILNMKKDTTALIVYAPPGSVPIPDDVLKKLNSKRNVIVVNLRGRLLNDIIVCLMTTGYQ